MTALGHIVRSESNVNEFSLLQNVLNFVQKQKSQYLNTEQKTDVEDTFECLKFCLHKMSL